MHLSVQHGGQCCVRDTIVIIIRTRMYQCRVCRCSWTVSCALATPFYRRTTCKKRPVHTCDRYSRRYRRRRNWSKESSTDTRFCAYPDEMHNTRDSWHDIVNTPRALNNKGVRISLPNVLYLCISFFYKFIIHVSLCTSKWESVCCCTSTWWKYIYIYTLLVSY